MNGFKVLKTGKTIQFKGRLFKAYDMNGAAVYFLANKTETSEIHTGFSVGRADSFQATVECAREKIRQHDAIKCISAIPHIKKNYTLGKIGKTTLKMRNDVMLRVTPRVKVINNMKVSK
jgi:hypothetical protein